MTDIFVSYATEDRERVRKLVSKLEEHGWQIWWDREIKTGKSFEDEIEKAIDTARCILVVWSYASVESEWVRTEAREGLDRNILIPITIDDVRPPLAYRRLQTNYLPGFPDSNYEDEFSRLTSSINGLLESQKLGHDIHDEGESSERRYISVLTCALHEKNPAHDPEVAHEQGQHIKEVIQQLIKRFTGYLYQFSKSNVVVVFGLPSTHEEDTLYAVNLGLQIRLMLKNLSRRVIGSENNQITIESSITRGQVIVSKENERINKYTITGNVFEEGQRLLQHATHGNIILSESAYKLISKYVNVEPITHGGENFFRVKSASLVTSRIEAAKSTGLTEFCGRTRERDQIFSSYSLAAEGTGQVVTLIGEAGIGKSRLLYELRDKLPIEEIFLLEGRCHAYGSNTAYYPYVVMLRQYLRLDNIPTIELHDVTVNALLSFFPELEQFIPHYLHLLSIPSEKYQLPVHLQGESMRLALQDALVSLIALIARRKTTVIVFEDWHWADDASTAVLHHLMHITVTFPMLIIVSCRPEYHPGWTSLEHHNLVRITSFSEKDTQVMISFLADAKEIPPRLVKELHKRTGGNPFFIEELCTSLLEQNKIIAQQGKLIVKDGIDSLILPDSVQTVLRTRLDQLDREALEILRTASVIGREFSRSLLEVTTGKNVDLILRGLIEIGIISQTRVFPNPEYMFKHVLIQVVTYETLLIKFRKNLHQLVAKNILEIYPESSYENTEVLAYHFSLSDDIDNAIKYSILAGERAVARSAHRETLEHLRRADQLLDTLPDDRPHQLLKLRISLSLGPTLVFALGYSAPDVIATYEKAIENSKALGATEQLFAALWGLWRYYNASSTMSKATELAYQLLELGEKSAKPEQKHSAYSAIIVSETYNGNIDSVLGFIQKLRLSYDPAIERSLAVRYGLAPMVLGLSVGASASVFAGNYSTAIAMNEEALAICKELDHKNSELMALFYYAATRFLGNDLKEAAQINIRLTEIAEQGKILPWTALGAFNVARDNLFTDGNIQNKLEDLITKANFASKVAPASKSASMLTLASIYLAMSNSDQCLACIEEGIDVLPAFKPEFLRLKAKAKFSQNKNANEALKTLDEAWQFAVEKNNLLWKLRILMDRIPWQQGLGLSIDDQVALLKVCIDQFAGDSETIELAKAKKYLASVTQVAKNSN